jgi:hypothetical protein
MEPTTLPIVVESTASLDSLTPEVAAAVKQLNVDPVRASRNSSFFRVMYSTGAAAAVQQSTGTLLICWRQLKAAVQIV